MVEALKTHAGEKPTCLVTAFQTFGKPPQASLVDSALSAANILVGPGSELLFDLLAILAGPVLVPVPAWVLRTPGGSPWETIPLETSRERGYRLSPETLARAARSTPGRKRSF